MTHSGYSGQAQVRRAYKFRAYPTRPQEGRAARLLADHCDLYNAALEERREAWRSRRTNVTYGTQSAQLRAIRDADPDGQGRHSFTAQQQTLRRLNVVFQAFYARAQAGGAGYPRFKAYSRFDQVLFVAGDGAGLEPSAGEWAHARFQAVGVVKVRQHRRVTGTVKTRASPRTVPMRRSSGCSVSQTLSVSRMGRLSTRHHSVTRGPRSTVATLRSM